MQWGFYPQFEYLRTSFIEIATRLREDIVTAAVDLDLGNITEYMFRRRTGVAIKKAYLLVFSLGTQSVDPFHFMTNRDLVVLENEIADENRFLRAFGHDIFRGRLHMPLEDRAFLYVRALRGIFERGRLEALPPGPYKWVRSDDDACLGCLSASMEGPYQREAFAGLGLPTIPGVPGDGSVCRGLTQCGCIMRYSNSPVANEEVQLQMRDWLEEVAHGSSRSSDSYGQEDYQVPVS